MYSSSESQSKSGIVAMLPMQPFDVDHIYGYFVQLWRKTSSTLELPATSSAVIVPKSFENE